MSEQEVLEQLADYGDWLARTTSEEIRPTGIQFVDAGGDQPIDLGEERLRRDRRPAKHGLQGLLVAAAVLAVAAAGWIALSRGSDTEEPAVFREDLVLPGETVLQQIPLVVTAVAGPEPEFDTSDLGTEIVWEPVLEITDEVRELVDQPWRGPEAESRTKLKVTVLGELYGELWISDVTDGSDFANFSDDPAEQNLRLREIRSLNGNSSGDVEMVPTDSRAFIDPPLPPAFGYGFGAPTGWVQLTKMSADTAAVSFTDSDQMLWMKPRGGVAFFPGQFDEGEMFTVSAYSADGTVLQTRTETVRYLADTPTTDPQVGDSMAGSQAKDLESGDTVLIGGNGKPSILVMGAAWCQPCAQVEAGIPLLNSLGDSVNIYGVSHYKDPLYSSDPWPPFDSWTFPRVELVDSPASDIGFVPAVLVIDGDDNVLALISDIENLESELENLGIRPPG